MEYCIINEIKLVDGNVNYSPIGYVTDMSKCDQINVNHEEVFVAWINDNKSGLEDGSVNISIFFDTTPVIYEANQTTTSVEGMGLTEITDITPYI